MSPFLHTHTHTKKIKTFCSGFLQLIHFLFWSAAHVLVWATVRGTLNLIVLWTTFIQIQPLVWDMENTLIITREEQDVYGCCSETHLSWAQCGLEPDKCSLCLLWLSSSPVHSVSFSAKRETLASLHVALKLKPESSGWVIPQLGNVGNYTRNAVTASGNDTSGIWLTDLEEGDGGRQDHAQQKQDSLQFQDPIFGLLSKIKRLVQQF